MPPSDAPKPAARVDALAVLDTVRRTEKLIKEFRRLKKNGGSRAALGRLRAEISELKATQAGLLEREGDAKGPCEPHEALPAPLPRSDGLMITPRSRPDRRPRDAVDASVQVGGAPDLRRGDAAEKIVAPAGLEVRDFAPPPASAAQAGPGYRRYCSVAFAVVLAEAHVRRELVHKCDRRRLKLLSRFREGCIFIALAPAHRPPRVGGRQDSPTAGLDARQLAALLPRATVRQEGGAANIPLSPGHGGTYTNNHKKASITSRMIEVRNAQAKPEQADETKQVRTQLHTVGDEWVLRNIDRDENAYTKRRAEEEAEAKRRAEEEAEAKRRAEEEAEAKRRAEE
ncbi:putative kinetoplast DNA-associated protein, partial [Trypanosoma conorhini]